MSDGTVQDRLQPVPGMRKKKVSLAIDTAGQNSLNTGQSKQGVTVTDSSLRGDGISVGIAGLRINELAACAASSAGSQPQRPVSHTRDGGGSEGDRHAVSEFKMIRVLGEGTSGVVKLVQHKHTGTKYAMKVIQLGCSEQERKQILVEVKTLHKSDVPNIIAFTNAFYVDNAVHLILEYMDCGSLATVLRRHGALPEPLLARVTSDMLGGLDHLHRVLKVVHRDIKPGNILLNSRAEVKLADFGMSGQLANTFSRLASWVGTAAYMSPERISGSQVHTPAAPPCAHARALLLHARCYCTRGVWPAALRLRLLARCLDDACPPPPRHAHAVFIRVGHLGARRQLVGVLSRLVSVHQGDGGRPRP